MMCSELKTALNAFAIGLKWSVLCWITGVACLGLLAPWENPNGPRYPASNSIISAYVNDSPTPQEGMQITVPYEGTVRFLVTPKPGFVRYMLQGLDQGWAERRGLMYFGLRFFKANGDEIDESTFLVSGRSPGWKDTLQNSSFTHRDETVTVPPGADHLAVFMSSAGPPASEGIFATTNIQITRPAGSGTEVILSSVSRLGGALSSAAPSSPLWLTGGTHPSMASIIGLRGASGPFRAFEINDQDVNGHADWYTLADAGPRVVPGEKLNLQWDEAYSNGMGDQLWATYTRMPAGHYTFKVETVGLSGTPTEEAISMVVHVPLPYWRNPIFWISFGVSTAAVIILVNWLIFRTNLRHQLARRRLIEEERLRIARDLHDDLGARLSEIVLTGSHAKTSSSPGTLQHGLEEVVDMAQTLSTSLSETVWMLNPKNDHLASLIDYLSRMVSTLCARVGMLCYVDASRVGDTIFVSSDQRHQVTLAVREALTNALKHAGASEIQFQIKYEPNVLKITIHDNGRGFSTAKTSEVSQGNGLVNMQQRLGSIHGHCYIDSSTDGGTRVVFEFPILLRSEIPIS